MSEQSTRNAEALLNVAYDAGKEPIVFAGLNWDSAQVATGSGLALFEKLSAAYERGEPILTYMWEPTWPIARFDLIQLEEPPYTPEQWAQNKGVAYPRSQIRKLLHPDLAQRAPEVSEFLKNVALPPQEISNVLLSMNAQDQKPEDAAKVWLQENEAAWSAWIPVDVAARVKQALGP